MPASRKRALHCASGGRVQSTTSSASRASARTPARARRLKAFSSPREGPGGGAAEPEGDEHGDVTVQPAVEVDAERGGQAHRRAAGERDPPGRPGGEQLHGERVGEEVGGRRGSPLPFRQVGEGARHPTARAGDADQAAQEADGVLAAGERHPEVEDEETGQAGETGQGPEARAGETPRHRRTLQRERAALMKAPSTAMPPQKVIQRTTMPKSTTPAMPRSTATFAIAWPAAGERPSRIARFSWAPKYQAIGDRR